MIQMNNVLTTVIVIPDLGIELQPLSFVRLDSIVSDDQIIASHDLISASVQFVVDGVVTLYQDLIAILTKINEYQHEKIASLVHNLNENAYFETTKVNGLTSTITYYTDSIKSIKIKEEEVFRSSGGKVSYIITTRYKNGIPVEKSTEQLNRISGKVVNTNTTVA